MPYRLCVALTLACLYSVARFGDTMTPFIRTYDVTRQTCAVDCFCHERCSQIIYDRLGHRCRMYETLDPVNCQSPTSDLAHLMSFYGITAAMCSGDVKYCPEMASVNYSVMYGNAHNVGAKRKVTCVPPYALNSPGIIGCLSNGTWSGQGQQCVQTCSPLNYRSNVECMETNRTVEGGDVIHTNGPEPSTLTLRYLEGSTLTLRCVNDATTSVVTTCTDGQWDNTPPICPGDMRQHCDVNADCLDTDAECRNNVCWCKPGLSYDRTTTSCVSSCTSYGNTYQVLENYVMWNYDIECTTVNIASLEDCIALCLSKTSYTCLSLDLRLDNECCTRDLVPSDIPPSAFFPDSAFTYVQRDCL